MRFTVLGPVRAWRQGTELDLGPPKRRALLALLLTQPGRPVAMHEIVDVLWGQDPPGSAVNVVHRHVGALRRLLEPDLPAGAASRTVVRGSGGYRLDVEADAVDLLRFRATREAGRRAARDGQPARATELLVEAMNLWRGPTAAGIAPQVRAHPVFEAVDREHLSIVKEAAETALEAGSGLTDRVLITLRQAAAHHPLDEVLQARLIVVLAATGHQAEALTVYQSVRSRLADELGLDPGPELREAQRQVLSGAGDHSGPRAATEDSGLDVPDGGDLPATGSAAAPAVSGPGAEQPYAPRERPAQLPADLSAFTGRRAELAGVQALLPDGDEPAAVVISAIGGMAGIGKTALAVHWAHEVAHRFPDGQLYVNLRGFDPTGPVMTPAEAIRGFLDAFGVPASRIPTGLDAQAALYRSLLAGRRVLVLLDNARDTEQVRPLLPGAAGCLAIVTSRNQLHGLIAAEGARPLVLDLLTVPEAREFLTRRLGPGRVATESRAVDQIIDLCGRLPLALAVVSARAAVHPSFPLSSIAAELRASHGSLDAFAGGEPVTDARSVFSWSYRTLSSAAARLFRLLALHPGPDCSTTATASLAGLRVPEVRPLLSELVRAHLLTEHAPGRFVSHELLRAYAAELTLGHDPEDAREDARRRLFDHYLHSAHTADARLAPYRERPALTAPSPGANPRRFSSREDAADWLTSERAVLLAAVAQDARSGTGTHCWKLAATLELFLDRHGRRQDQLAIQSLALTAAQALGDVPGQAHAHRALGFVSGRLQRHDDAREHLLRALELFAEIGDPVGQGRVHRYLAFQCNTMDRHAEALDHYRQASRFYRTAGHRSGQAGIFNEVGWTHILLGAYEEALVQCRQALALGQEIGDSNGTAAAWDSLGYAHHHLGSHQQALSCYGHALDLYREVSDRYLEADTLVHIGDTHEALGADRRAASAWQQALDILDGFGHPDAEPLREKLGRLDSATRRAAPNLLF
ncbi:AfsR/SARP family transcriptional regulator [Streptomyces sp. AK02-01A]|uniref:AfsR/SARP family transcriptional regulator n=1 Tax=Streptomyces sp. AK02-01A TaxID=3028648 RepID=UPI0029BAE4C9|nr:BTAD domain-containing putative transcriptional regulator [Streptomyces sp. AK02-01A]MDX3854577.1 BTAD domain-containing putative transcriptional regulator [Streptomyces sp. AK02-01A]